MLSGPTYARLEICWYSVGRRIRRTLEQPHPAGATVVGTALRNVDSYLMDMDG